MPVPVMPGLTRHPLDEEMLNLVQHDVVQGDAGSRTTKVPRKAFRSHIESQTNFIKEEHKKKISVS